MRRDDGTTASSKWDENDQKSEVSQGRENEAKWGETKIRERGASWDKWGKLDKTDEGSFPLILLSSFRTFSAFFPLIKLVRHQQIVLRTIGPIAIIAFINRVDRFSFLSYFAAWSTGLEGSFSPVTGLIWTSSDPSQVTVHQRMQQTRFNRRQTEQLWIEEILNLDVWLWSRCRKSPKGQSSFCKSEINDSIVWTAQQSVSRKKGEQVATI